MRSWHKILLLIGLWAAFWCFGLWVRSQIAVPLDVARDTELYSFDFQGYAQTFTDYHFISFGRFRHPLWGWLTSPVILFGQKVFSELGEQAFWIYIIGFFALVGTCGVALVYALVRRCGETTVGEALAATALFASFAHVWLLSGMPESFALAMLLALAALWWGAGSGERLKRTSFRIGEDVYEGPNAGACLDAVGWGLLTLLMGGITLTQGVKAVLGFLVVHRRGGWRRRLMFVVGLGAFVALVTLVFYIRVRVRVANDPAASGMDDAWNTLFGCVAPLSLPWGEYWRNVWVFFSEPILLRGEPFDQRTIVGGYDSFVQPVLLAVLYALALASAWANRRHVLVKLMGAMFLVDVAIHFVVRWGIAECQLYGGHWMYVPPVLIGLGFRRLPRKGRAWAVAGVWALAALLFACNVHGYFCHDVGLHWDAEGACGG